MLSFYFKLITVRLQVLFCTHNLVEISFSFTLSFNNCTLYSIYPFFFFFFFFFETEISFSEEKKRRKKKNSNSRSFISFSEMKRTRCWDSYLFTYLQYNVSQRSKKNLLSSYLLVVFFFLHFLTTPSHSERVNIVPNPL